jgi:hypothetical protein
VVVVVGAVVVGVGLEGPEELGVLVVVVDGVVVVVVDSVVLVVVGGTVVGTELAGFAVPARYATSSADTNPEPKRRAWVRRRARAKRRSRC